LLNSFGPVAWTHSIYVPDYDRSDERSSFLLHGQEQAASRFLSQPTACELHPGGASLAELASREIPGAISRALAELARSIENGVPAVGQSQPELIGLGRAWLSTMQRAGLPESRPLAEPPVPAPDPRAFAAEVARGQVEVAS
jgi:yersiniabactin synthetase, thiazolinyl reductase component